MQTVNLIDVDVINKIVGEMPPATTIEDYIEQGLAVETACYEKTTKVIDSLNEIRRLFKEMASSARRVEDLYAEVKSSGMLHDEWGGAQTMIDALSRVHVLASVGDMIGDALGCDKTDADKHFSRNIQDLRELKAIVELTNKIGEHEKTLKETEVCRQKPIFRELRRLNLQLANSGASIISGHFHSPNCPDEIAEKIYEFVKSTTEEAKKKANELKKVA